MVRRLRSGWKASLTCSTVLDPTQKHLHGRARTRARVIVPEDIDAMTYTYGCISAGSIRRLDIPAITHLHTTLLYFLNVFWHGIKSYLARNSLENHILLRRICVGRWHSLSQIIWVIQKWDTFGFMHFSERYLWLGYIDVIGEGWGRISLIFNEYVRIKFSGLGVEAANHISLSTARDVAAFKEDWLIARDVRLIHAGIQVRLSAALLDWLWW
jgi:hypothetical protein